MLEVELKSNLVLVNPPPKVLESKRQFSCNCDQPEHEVFGLCIEALSMSNVASQGVLLTRIYLKNKIYNYILILIHVQM